MQSGLKTKYKHIETINKMIKTEIIDSKRTIRIRQLVDLTEGIDWLISKNDDKLALQFAKKLEEELFELYLETTQALDRIKTNESIQQAKQRL